MLVAGFSALPHHSFAPLGDSETFLAPQAGGRPHGAEERAVCFGHQFTLMLQFESIDEIFV